MTGEEMYSEGNELLREIVNAEKIPADIVDFWERLVQASRSSEGWNVISVINAMSSQKIPGGIHLLGWYEILRDIYLIRVRHQESLSLPVKTPIFTTVDRSFEQYAFLPEFWFGKSDVSGETKGGVPSGDLKAHPEELLFSIERYMYNQEGGACWSALDWNIVKYCFRVVCEPALQEKDPPVLKLAALLLAAHFIVSGKMGLYVSERGADVRLPYAGIIGGGQTGSQLLKYFHFDRFTRFSFIRSHELTLDADGEEGSAMLEPRWQANAALTEFLLLSKSARATKTTCARVGMNVMMEVMYKLRSENALGRFPGMPALMDHIIELLDDPEFGRRSVDELLSEIGVARKVVSADYFLRKNGIFSAQDFWRLAESVFREIQQSYESIYYATISKFSTGEYLRQTNDNVLLQDDCVCLLRSLQCHRLNELSGRLHGLRLRTTLKNLLLTEQLELHSGHLAMMLEKNFHSENILLYLPTEQQWCTLPSAWLTRNMPPKKVPETLQTWCQEILSEFSMDGKTREIARDYSKLDGETVQRASDDLWNTFFGRKTAEICRDRWMLSLQKAIRILEGTKERLRGVKLPQGHEREHLLEKNRRELDEMSGGREFDTVEAEKRLMEFDGYSLGKVTPGALRTPVMIDLIARLTVATGKSPSLLGLWNHFDDLKIFFTHLLCATMGKLEYPFPFHLGILSDSLLRLSRNNNQDQRDNIDRLLKHKYDNAGERYLYLMALYKYLHHSQDPRKVLDVIMGSPAMVAFASAERLSRLLDA